MDAARRRSWIGLRAALRSKWAAAALFDDWHRGSFGRRWNAEISKPARHMLCVPETSREMRSMVRPRSVAHDGRDRADRLDDGTAVSIGAWMLGAVVVP